MTPDRVSELLQDLGNFAVVEPSLVGYYEAGKTKYYLTVDLVDPWDAERRMLFVATPSGQYADPEDLLADWHAYEQRVAQLIGSGRIPPAAGSAPLFAAWATPQIQS